MSAAHVVLLVAACVFAAFDKSLRWTAGAYVFLMFFCEWLVHPFTHDKSFYFMAGISELCIVFAMLSFSNRAATWIAIASAVNAVVWFGYYSAYFFKSFTVFEYFLLFPTLGEYSQILAIIVFSKPIFSRLYVSEHQHKKDLKNKDNAQWLETWNYL